MPVLLVVCGMGNLDLLLPSSMHTSMHPPAYLPHPRPRICHVTFLQAIALMVLKQSDDPKFPLYSELPTPTGSGVQSMSSPAGVPLPMHHPFHPPPAPFHMAAAGPMAAGAGAPGPAAAGAMFGGLPFALPAGAGMAAAEGYAPLSLMLTEDQAGVLMDQGSRALVEVEQVSSLGDQGGCSWAKPQLAVWQGCCSRPLAACSLCLLYSSLLQAGHPNHNFRAGFCRLHAFLPGLNCRPQAAVHGWS
jgi:hypothetical protein